MATKIEWTDDTVALFWRYVRKSDGCWEWLGGTFGGRYGQFRAFDRKVKAHRFAWEITNGPVPAGKIVCHRCDNVRCVRPDHLFLGTHADNAADRDAKGRGARFNAPALTGELNPSAVLTAAKVATIRARLAQGERRADIALEFQVSKSTIDQIARGEIWRTQTQK